ncbi:MAG TPA: glycosyltransferase [Polyangiales bacterium]|jgi:ceramide glucosyltransferase|nr:glycosyltransferase [Polyangiales bacterium]
MFSATASIFLALTAVAAVLHRLGVWATFRHTKLRAEHASEPAVWPALTLLKPIKGLEEQLEQNLRSFCGQSYPGPLQIVFASTDPLDPGLALARRIVSQYPNLRDVQFVISDPSFGMNPKVANLAGALRAARHDLVLQTDANVRIRSGYLRAVVAEFQREQAAMLGSLIAGTGERSLGAVLDNIQLTTFTTPGICLASEVADIQCVIGKSMLFRRSELNALGGLALVKDVLAEDFVLGQAYQAAGKKVVLSRLTVENVNIDTPLPRFLSRHSRWLKMRVVIHVGGFVADLLSNATFFALMATLFTGFDPRVLLTAAAVIAHKTWLDSRILTRLRGMPMAPLHVLCIPLRDVTLPLVWVYALFSRTTEWRGERFRLGTGSVLTPVGHSVRPPAAEARPR